MSETYVWCPPCCSSESGSSGSEESETGIPTGCCPERNPKPDLTLTAIGCDGHVVSTQSHFGWCFTANIFYGGDCVPFDTLKLCCLCQDDPPPADEEDCLVHQYVLKAFPGFAPPGCFLKILNNGLPVSVSCDPYEIIFEAVITDLNPEEPMCDCCNNQPITLIFTE